MVKILYFVLILAVLSNCTRNPVIKTHGISYLEKRQKSLVLNKSNTNDARKLLGSPSSIGIFDNTVWILTSGSMNFSGYFSEFDSLE